MFFFISFLPDFSAQTHFLLNMIPYYEAIQVCTKNNKNRWETNCLHEEEFRWSGADIHPGDLDNNLLHPTLLYWFFLRGSFSDENARICTDLNILWG